MTVNSLRAKQVILLAGLLLLEGKIPPVSVAFLVKSYLDLSDLDNFTRGLTIKRMADNYGCTSQAARKHVIQLSHHKILIQTERGKSWYFNWDYLSRLNKLDDIDF